MLRGSAESTGDSDAPTGALGGRLGPWLAHWDPTHSAHIADRLAQAVVERQRDEEFGHWLHSAARLRALEEAFEAYCETPQAESIAAAVDHLRSKLGVRAGPA